MVRLRPLPLRHSLIAILLLSSILSVLLLASRHPPRLRILVPEMSGDGVLAMMPDGQTVLIDGSADGAALATWLGNTLPFGQRKLDVVILTRADAATLPGQLAALKRYHVGMALIGNIERRSSSLDAWWQLLEEQHAAIHTITAGDRLKLGQCMLSTLAEQEGRLALMLECGGTTAHLLQALDDDIEAALEVQSLPHATLVIYPWSRATDTALLRMLQPTAIVFSEGGDQPSQVTWSDRRVGAARLYHEALNGQIELIDDGDRATIKVERGE